MTGKNTEAVKACPKCDSLNIKKTKGNNSMRGTKPENEYVCVSGGCCYKFDEPVTRQRKHSRITRSGLSKKLAEMGGENA